MVSFIAEVLWTLYWWKGEKKYQMGIVWRLLDRR